MLVFEISSRRNWCESVILFRQHPPDTLSIRSHRGDRIMRYYPSFVTHDVRYFTRPVSFLSFLFFFFLSFDSFFSSWICLFPRVHFARGYWTTSTARILQPEDASHKRYKYQSTEDRYPTDWKRNMMSTEFPASNTSGPWSSWERRPRFSILRSESILPTLAVFCDTRLNDASHSMLDVCCFENMLP